jgi:hypothetical protein
MILCQIYVSYKGILKVYVKLWETLSIILIDIVCYDQIGGGKLNEKS